MNLWKKMKLCKKLNTLRKQLERTTDGTENGEGGTNITILNAD